MFSDYLGALDVLLLVHCLYSGHSQGVNSGKKYCEDVFLHIGNVNNYFACMMTHSMR